MLLRQENITHSVSPGEAVQRFECDTPDGSCRVYRIPARVLPHLTGFVHLLLGNFPPTLIDAGSGEGGSSPHIFEGLETVRRRFGESFVPQDLARVFLTHTHVDHFGGAGSLAAFLGAGIGVHPADSRVVCAHAERARVSNREFDRFLIQCGIDRERRPDIIQAFGFTPGRTRSAPVDRLLRDGDVIDGIRVHHTPGHSPGHLVFEIGPFLLLGDLLLSKTITQIWPQTLVPGTGLERHLQSLRRLGEIAENVLRDGWAPIGLPGHEAVIGDIPRRIEGIRRNHERRCERLLDVLEKSPVPLSIAELTARMYVNGSLARSLMALADVAARVEYLQLQARIAVANADEPGEEPLPAYRYTVIREQVSGNREQENLVFKS